MVLFGVGLSSENKQLKTYTRTHIFFVYFSLVTYMYIYKNIYLYIYYLKLLDNQISLEKQMCEID